MELNPIICRKSFKLAKISKKFDNYKSWTHFYTLRNLPYKKSLKPFVQRNSCPLYECPTLPNVLKVNTRLNYLFYRVLFMYQVLENETLDTITFSTKCQQMKHLVQCYFVLSV
jgi:hypothetical protein